MAKAGYFDDRYGEWVEYEEDTNPSLWTKIKTGHIQISQGKHTPPISQGKHPPFQSKHTSPPPRLNHTLTPEERQRGAVKGSLKGGLIRAQKLSPERRAAIARQAALTRWSK